MLRVMMKSKIHRATITGADLHYEGSITIATELLRAADILPLRWFHVYNISNGEQFETYALEGEEDSGVICLNGAQRERGRWGFDYHHHLRHLRRAELENCTRTQDGHGGPPHNHLKKYCLG